MAPELVVANAPYKVYPGGVIALRCTDWLGGARGTLTTESDSRANTGEVVREAQQVTASIASDGGDAFDEADATIEVDLSTLPIEDSSDMEYGVLISYLIEGDWDPTNTDTIGGNTDQARFIDACAMNLDNVSFYTGGSWVEVLRRPRFREHFIYASFDAFTFIELDGSETLRIKAYAQAGTTIEFLLDQIIFIPSVEPGAGPLGSWTDEDFASVPGVWDRDTTGDGADGGDDNGEFTIIHTPEEPAAELFGSEGGGDYQRKASHATAEYFARVPSTDQEIVQNSVAGAESLAHAYSLCGQNYRPARVHHSDSFGRTVNGAGTQPGAWETDDITPEGFGLMARGEDTGGGPTYCAVNGSEGVMHMGGQLERTARCTVSYGEPGHPGADFMICNPRFSGFFHVDSLGSVSFSATTQAYVRVNFVEEDYNIGSGNYELIFDVDDNSWSICRSSAAASVVLFGPVDISSWFTADSSPSATVGWIFEIKRHLLRAKVWDASGAEPGTWDAEIFRPYWYGPFPLTDWYDYPYTAAGANQLFYAGSVNKRYFLELTAGHGVEEEAAITTWEVHWDDITVEEDPYGDSTDIHIAVERPEGSLLDEMTIPEGAQYLVYWGTSDWTEPEGSDFAVDFSALVWNPTTAAELQRAELMFFWFRSIHGGIVSMNWNSALPVDITRVHG